MIVNKKYVINSEKNVVLPAMIADGTINISVCNQANSVEGTTMTLWITATPDAPVDSELIESGIALSKGATYLRMGEPVNTGESVVIQLTGSQVGAAVRVSGFSE